MNTFDYKWTDVLYVINLILEHHICSHVTISKSGTVKLVALLVYSDYAYGYLDYHNDITPICYSCLSNISLNMLVISTIPHLYLGYLEQTLLVSRLSWRYKTDISVISTIYHRYLSYLDDILLISQLSQRNLTDISVILMISHRYFGYLDGISLIYRLSRHYLTDNLAIMRIFPIF